MSSNTQVLYKNIKNNITQLFKHLTCSSHKTKTRNLNNTDKEKTRKAILLGFASGLILLCIFFKVIVINLIFNYNNKKYNSNELNLFTQSNNYLTTTHDNFQQYGHGETLITLKEDNNLFSTLYHAGFNKDEINCIIATLHGKINFRTIPYGQTFLIKYTFDMSYQNIGASNIRPIQKHLEEKRHITSLSFKQPKGLKYLVEKNEGGYVLHIEKPKLSVKTHIVSGTIKNNLFTDVIIDHIKPSTLYNMLNEYAFLIDFQRDLHYGDEFIFILETTRDSDGDLINEKILYSNLILSGKKYEIFNFYDKFYDRNGRSIHKNLLRTPVDGARISSGFNPKRRHPILGYTRAHKGIDLAAPTGTPIYSAGDGVIADIQLNHPSYGKYVLIRHNAEYSTKYAHMSRIAHIRIGQPVKQRQVIGYVGMTGLATGPHLHYEVIRHGKQINPRNIKVVEKTKLNPAKIEEFNNVVEEIDKILSN